MTSRDIVFTLIIVAVVVFGYWLVLMDTEPRLSGAELQVLVQQSDKEVADFQADIQRRSRLWDVPASADLFLPGRHATGDTIEGVLLEYERKYDSQ